MKNTFKDQKKENVYKGKSQNNCLYFLAFNQTKKINCWIAINKK